MKPEQKFFFHPTVQRNSTTLIKGSRVICNFNLELKSKAFLDFLKKCLHNAINRHTYFIFPIHSPLTTHTRIRVKE
ncbi:hypothetical protein Glove_120g157 [Diversispora epigaea]|uniref:Uncharacterized protein n=1 Tax=Diversispora epigaea TaxID=1348612 RepID=A0A397J9T0_9GLOM|nr:hypothetical protein Glove_120g157 [Diversispora epigaea]